jgi:hypothetical protein
LTILDVHVPHRGKLDSKESCGLFRELTMDEEARTTNESEGSEEEIASMRKEAAGDSRSWAMQLFPFFA